MTSEVPEPQRQNTALIVLALAALLLLGTLVGFLLGNRDGGSSDTTIISVDTTTTTAPSTTAEVTVPATVSGTSTIPAPVPTGDELVFEASEDTVVSSSEPDTNFGGAEVLEIEQDGPDDMRWALVRFDVTGIPADRAIVRATLRLTVLDASSQVALVNLVLGPWTEATTTWVTAPPLGDPIAPLPVAAELTQIEADVTPAVVGPGAVDLYLTLSSQDGLDVASRQNSLGGPELVVTLGAPGEAGPAQGTVLVGAGDIASCASQGDEETAGLLDQIVARAVEAVVYTTGDNAYEAGSQQSFADCYDPSWGRHKGITRPAVGSREYRTPAAAGYFGYFGDAAGDPSQGYYSYDLDGWHMIVLNSNCARVGGCELESPQGQWLAEDLRSSVAACTLAYWQLPLFTSGRAGANAEMLPMFKALYDAESEIVINGNDHFYERFAMQAPDGSADPEQGIRQFTVGTGGRSLDQFATPVVNSEIRFNDAFGVLALALAANSYEWRFYSVTGSDFSEIGGGTCH